MNENFRNGFEKTANEALIAVLAGLGIVGGLGAATGHLADVSKKIDAAKHGVEVDRESWIQQNPMMSGALSLGLAPVLSEAFARKKNNRHNSRVRGVLDKHPYASAILGEG